MNNYIIHRESIVYMALYLKRQLSPYGNLTLSQAELDNYTSMVMRNIERERAVSNGFIYTIVDGEPVYDISLADEKTKERFNKCTYSYDARSGIYSTPSSSNSLILKSKYVIPCGLIPFFTAEGFEKIFIVDCGEPGLR